MDVPAGEAIEHPVSFRSDQALPNITIAVVPELARFVTIDPSAAGKVPAGTPVDLKLRFSVPPETPAGSFEGTVHVRDGNRTLARPLPLTVRVVAERPTWQSKGVVTLSGLSPATFNPINTTLRFVVSAVSFSQLPGEVMVRLNGEVLPHTMVSATEVSTTISASEGRNRLSLQAIDDAGRLLFFAVTFWAGSRTLRMRVVDERGQPAEASVILKAGDDQRVSATASTVAGTATFPSVNDRTLLVEAHGPENRFGQTATHGGAGSVVLPMRAFEAPSPIANNDFRQGTSGWNVGRVPVRIVPHVEAAGGSSLRATQPASVARPADRDSGWRDFQNQHRPHTAAAATPGDDVDLVVPTQGEGPQTVSRTFQTAPSIKSVVVRHRFVTSEVPGGWFGSEFNDSFSVTLRSQAAGGVATLSQTMNGLGLEAFIFDTGETREWFEARLPVDREGDVIQIDATVSNVGDGLYDSQLIIDLVKEKRVEIGPLEAVVCGATATVEVTMPANEPPVTLELTSSGEGEATFAGGETTMTITATTTVTINGVKISSTSGDVRLTASAEGEELDSCDFTVIWVELEIRNRGPVSQDNDAAWKYVDMMGTDQLGFVVLGAKLNYNLFTCAIEAVGTVKPDDFQGEIVPMRFLIQGAHYQNEKLTKEVPPGIDISRYLIDTDPRPEGHVYDIDAPGDRAHGHALGIVYRQRINMRQWFIYKDQIVSDIKPWFTRTSFRRLEGRVYEAMYDAPGDNQCGEGETSLTWNLQ
ncbi:MAG: hypothetical protein ABI779_15970 [Acidobacteriota bacterium]